MNKLIILIILRLIYWFKVYSLTHTLTLLAYDILKHEFISLIQIKDLHIDTMYAQKFIVYNSVWIQAVLKLC